MLSVYYVYIFDLSIQSLYLFILTIKSVCRLPVYSILSDCTIYLFYLSILLYMLDLGIYGQSTHYTTGGEIKAWLNKAPSKVSCPHAI